MDEKLLSLVIIGIVALGAGFVILSDSATKGTTGQASYYPYSYNSIGAPQEQFPANLYARPQIVSSAPRLIGGDCRNSGPCVAQGSTNSACPNGLVGYYVNGNFLSCVNKISYPYNTAPNCVNTPIVDGSTSCTSGDSQSGRSQNCVCR